MKYKMAMRDISAETFGKYQYCTKNKEDGLFYADSDFGWDGLKPGALPAPNQHDPEKTARAQKIIQAHAAKITKRVLRSHTLFGRFLNWLDV